MVWIPIADLRGEKGEPGYNATGAAEDDAAIAALVRAASGPTLTQGELDTRYAGRAGFVGEGPAVWSHTATSFPGSAKAGNLVNTGRSVTLPSGAGDYNALPGIVLANDGSLVAVWRNANNHTAPGDLGKLYQSRSLDFGATWSTPVVVVSDPVLDVRDVMLSKLRDGRLTMFYFTHDGTKPVSSHVRFSSDNGATWGAESAPLPFTGTLWAAASGYVVEAANGDLLVCAYTLSTGYSSVRMLRSTDGGATWGSEILLADGNADGFSYQEPVLGVLPNGNLMVLIRTAATPATGEWSRVSTDNGFTWSPLVNTFPAGDGRPGWISLASGAILHVYRGSTTGKPHYYVTSWDNGATWSAPTLLDLIPSGQSVYSQAIEVAAGLVAVIYSDESSPVSVAAVRVKYLADGYGITPLGDRVLAAGQETAALTASQMILTSGTPNLVGLTGFGYPPAWHLDPAASESVAGVFARLPSDWKTFDIIARWAPVSAAAGSVVVQFIGYWLADGQLVNVEAKNATKTMVSPAVSGRMQSDTIASGILNTGTQLSARLIRLATNGSDTYAGDMGLISLVAVRAS